MLRTQALEQLQGDSRGQRAKSGGGLARAQRLRSAHRESSRAPPCRQPAPAARPRAVVPTSPMPSAAGHGERSPRELAQTAASLTARASRYPLIFPPRSRSSAVLVTLRAKSVRSGVDPSASCLVRPRSRLRQAARERPPRRPAPRVEVGLSTTPAEEHLYGPSAVIACLSSDPPPRSPPRTTNCWKDESSAGSISAAKAPSLSLSATTTRPRGARRPRPIRSSRSRRRRWRGRCSPALRDRPGIRPRQVDPPS